MKSSNKTVEAEDLTSALILILAFLSSSSCSASSRSTDNPNLPDSGPDTDLAWEGGNGDFGVEKPAFLSPETGGCGGPLMGNDGNNLAISIVNVELENQTKESTLLLAFPWNQPSAVQWSFFLQEPPACPGSYQWGGPVSKPYPVDGGFFVLTSTIGYENESCQVVRSLWNAEAELVDGPHAWYDIYPGERYHVMSPFGVQQDDGTVTVGNLKCVGCTDSQAGNEEVVFQLDRFGVDGLHQSLLEQGFDWTEQVAETGHVFSGYGGQNAFEWEEVYTVVGWGSEAVILARGTAAGEILQPPEVVIPAPDPKEDLATAVSSRSFAQNEGELLVLVKLFHLESWEQIPIPVELVSYVLNMKGEIHRGPTPLVAYGSHVYGDTPMATWSGRYFGVCYREPFDTFKFMALDENGELARDPVAIFWPIPPVENRLSPCDIVALNEESFAVAMSVHSDGDQPYQDGMYVTYVTALFVE